jgi:hypothetical protein
MRASLPYTMKTGCHAIRSAPLLRFLRPDKGYLVCFWLVHKQSKQTTTMRTYNPDTRKHVYQGADDIECEPLTVIHHPVNIR